MAVEDFPQEGHLHPVLGICNKTQLQVTLEVTECLHCLFEFLGHNTNEVVVVAEHLTVRRKCWYPAKLVHLTLDLPERYHLAPDLGTWYEHLL